MKVCTFCKQALPLSAFWRVRDRLRSRCKTCLARDERLRLYGLTQEDYDSMIESQANACAICFTGFKATPNIDHSHLTGRVRGLLCWRCNATLGKVSDNPDILIAMANYLKEAL